MKKWIGPKPVKCDICSGSVEHGWVDGKTRFGPWGIMCKSCHLTHGAGLGTGRGQQYDSEGKKVGG